MTLSSTADLQSERLTIDSFLSKILPVDGSKNAPSIVHEAMRYAVLGSAQRIRPILSLRVGHMVGAPPELSLRLAASVELLHCASLVVDDLPSMDNAPYRRGKPSVHAEFGEAVAILAAFGLVALAARNVLETHCHDLYRPRMVEFQLALLRSLDCAGLIAGQAMDLQRPHSSSCALSELKTVPLFNLAVQAGASLADLHANENALLACFGREFGLAFQMSDDLLDGELSDRTPFEEKLFTLRAAIRPFGPRSKPLENLIDYLQSRVSASCAR